MIGAAAPNNSNLLASVKLLESFGNVRVLSSPRLTVLNNQTAILKVVDNQVYFTIQSTTVPGTGGSPAITTFTTTPNIVAVGLIMNVTPQISDADSVLLNVRPSISRIVGNVPDPNPSLVVTSNIPVIQTREMESLIKVNSGQIAVMGGLIQDRVNDLEDSVPGASRLAGYGGFFGNKNLTNTKTELVVFMRPIIIRDASIDGDYRGYRSFLPDDKFLSAPNPGKPPLLGEKPGRAAMSLLLEALKKAELAKQAAKEQPPATDKPPFTRDKLPDISQPMEIRSEDLSLVDAPPASAQANKPVLELALEEPPRAAPPPPRALPLEEPEYSAPSEIDERKQAQQLFEAKEMDVNPRKPFYITVGALVLFALGTVGYFWYELQPKNNYKIPPPLAQSVAPPVAAPPMAAAPAAGPAPPAASTVTPPSGSQPALATPAASAPGATAAGAAPAGVQTGERSAAPAAPSRAGDHCCVSAAAFGPARRRHQDHTRADADRPRAAKRLSGVQLRRHGAGTRGLSAGAAREPPNNRDALLGLAAVEMQSRRYAAAESFYTRLIELDPRDAHAQAGLIGLKGQSDPVSAESRLKNMIAAQPEASFLNFTLGNQYASQDRWAEAQQAYFRAYTGDPEHPDFAYNLAVSLDKLHQTKAALEYYRRALKLAEARPVTFDQAQVKQAGLAARELAMNSPATPAAAAKRHIGQILISQGILTEDQLRIALLEQMKSKLPVGKLLVNLGFVSEATLRDALSEKLGLQSVDLSQIIIDPQAMKLVPRDFAVRHHIFPIALDRDRGTLIVALSDTNNLVAMDQLRARLRGELELESRLAGDTEISRAIDQYYGHELSIDGILHEIETGEVDYQSLAGAGERVQPAGGAADRGAASPTRSEKRLRHPLRAGTEFPAHPLPHRRRAAPNPLAAQNLLAGDGGAHQGAGENEHRGDARAPGRTHSLSLTGRQVDFRVASQATSHGENVVLRILDRQKGIVPLDGLGLESSQLDLLKKHDRAPEGIILVTGPTGSGKTTTLYSILNHINSDTAQHHDHGRPGRVPDDPDPPDLGQRGGENGLRQRHPFAHAPGPGRDPGGRDPRRGNRRNGVPRRHDRPPGLFDAAHQLRRRRVPAPARYRRHRRGHGGQYDRHHRPAPDPAPVQTLPPALHGDFGRMPPARRQGRPAAHHLPRGGLRPLRLPGLPRAPGDHGNTEAGRRHRRTDRPPRHRARTRSSPP